MNFLTEYSLDEFEEMDYRKLQDFAKQLPGVDGRSSKEDILNAIENQKERLDMSKKKVTALTTDPTPVVTEDGNYPLKKGQSVECEEVKNEEELGNSVRIEEVSGSSASSNSSDENDNNDDS